jgi:outer membrane protein assembly factor BamD (BamD/ComL family)
MGWRDERRSFGVEGSVLPMPLKRWTILILALPIVAGGCHKRVSANTSLSLPPPAVNLLDHADQEFKSGKYKDAERSYEDYLQLFPDGSLRDQALFRLGLSRAFDGNPPDWPGAITTLKQLMDEFPQSPLRPAAALILSLHAEVAQLTVDSKQRDQRIKQLNTELDKIKQIDAQRKKP